MPINPKLAGLAADIGRARQAQADRRGRADRREIASKVGLSITKSEDALADIGQITLTVRGETRTFDVAKELSLLAEKDDVLWYQAKRFAFWGLVLADAEKLRDEKAHALDVLRDEMFLGYTAELKRLNQDSSVTTVRALVRSEPKVVKAEQQLIEAQHLVAQMKVVVQAWEHRRSALMKMFKHVD